MTAFHDRIVDALGNRTYPFALQLGAGDGALTERLAPRCGRLITLERDPAAVEAARRRLELVPNIDVRLGAAPADVPRWTFDLVVCPGEPDKAVLDVMPRGATLLVIGRDAEPHFTHPDFVRIRGDEHDGRVLDRFERR